MRFTISRCVTAALACMMCTLLIWGGWHRWFAWRDTLPAGPAKVAPDDAPAGMPVAADAPAAGDIADRTHAFCGACHAMPPAASFPRSAWRKEVDQGFEFYRESRRTDLVAPPREQVVALFEARAPKRWVLPPTPPDEPAVPLAFRHEDLNFDDNALVQAIASLHLVALEREGPPSLLFCDMFSGEIGALRRGSASFAGATLAWLSNPCRVEPCDLDQDGVTDLVVADLGSFEPRDHSRGRVVWMRRESAEAARWEAVVLRAGLGRVADVEPGDFDGDGRTDLLVAEFGWRRTGRILMLRNSTGPSATAPEFELRVLDPRHGAIHVPSIDLNGDGRLDFVALISQEHEVIEGFLNTGDGTFRREVIHAANDPAFGSTGIELVDLDGDGDADVLYTNGDALDSNIAKPYHAVQWLENTGGFPFKHHHLTVLPGAMRARAADLDRDGRLDVVAAAFLPEAVLDNSPGAEFDSLIWLKQGANGEFTRHRIERGSLQHVALEVFDADGDGLVDIFTGSFSARHDRIGPRITAWWNAGSARPVVAPPPPEAKRPPATDADE